MFTVGQQATPDVSLIKSLVESALATPDKVYAADVEGRELTYRQTVEQARIWAAAWRRLGVKAGDHVVTMQYNTLDSLLGWLGLAWIGAVEAPINNDYRGQLLSHALNLTRAPVMLLLDGFVDRILEVADDLQYLKKVVIVGDGLLPRSEFQAIAFKDFFTGLSPAVDLSLPHAWDIMAVLFTSGTTGPSKAVRLPWAQIHAMATGTYPVGDLKSDEVIYNAGPTYHVGAKVFPYLAALCGGRHLMRPFISRTASPSEYLRFGVTTGGVVHEWLRDPPPRAAVALRNALTPYRDPLADQFAKAFGVRRFGCFNMTEISCPVHFRAWDAVIYDDAGRMSCGVVRDGYEVRIVDANDQPVADGEPGEMIVRANVPWVLNAGYLNNPDATVQAWRNGWFHTGDAFLRDKDGNYFFLDRMKDCIRRNGENISSFEVEANVNAHPAVEKSAAVAVKRSDMPGANEEIKIVVELKPGATLPPDELIKWLIPRAPRFMIPRYVEFMDALPLTPTLKVRKAVLRESGATATWDREKAGIALPRDATGAGGNS